VAVAIGAFYRASPRPTIATILVATQFRLLQPAFVVATGFLVSQAAASGAAITLPLTVLVAVFTTTLLLGPVHVELGLALWRRVDHPMGDRIMLAIFQPATRQSAQT
jgi:hypothetical protein